MIHEKPRTTALAFGSTVAILYSLCALAFALFPNATAGFVRSINHGLNLQALDIGQVPFTFGEFFVGLICITVYALIAGFIYGSVRNVLHRREGETFPTVQRTSAASA